MSKTKTLPSPAEWLDRKYGDHLIALKREFVIQELDAYAKAYFRAELEKQIRAGNIKSL